MRFRGGGATAAVVLVAMLSVPGCTSNDALSRQYRDGDTKNYISGDGAVTEFDAKDAAPAVNFTATTTDGKTVSARDYRGKVLVLNFWFALCGPCGVEAADLNSISASKSDEATFIGVNVRDEAGTAESFIRSFKVPYTNILDAKGLNGAARVLRFRRTERNAVDGCARQDRSRHRPHLGCSEQERSRNAHRRRQPALTSRHHGCRGESECPTVGTARTRARPSVKLIAVRCGTYTVFDYRRPVIDIR